MDCGEADGIVRLTAADGVVYRRGSGDSIELVISRQPDGKWRLPKGVAEQGETNGETAMREVEEEIGLSVTAAGRIGESTYRFERADDGALCEKTVTFYPDVARWRWPIQSRRRVRARCLGRVARGSPATHV